MTQVSIQDEMKLISELVDALASPRLTVLITNHNSDLERLVQAIARYPVVANVLTSKGWCYLDVHEVMTKAILRASDLRSQPLNPPTIRSEVNRKLDLLASRRRRRNEDTSGPMHERLVIRPRCNQRHLRYRSMFRQPMNPARSFSL